MDLHNHVEHQVSDTIDKNVVSSTSDDSSNAFSLLCLGHWMQVQVVPLGCRSSIFDELLIAVMRRRYRNSALAWSLERKFEMSLRKNSNPNELLGYCS
ncbi:unknown [Rhynchosia yellow mosaic India virus]|uniref:Uncharacterized protein AC5 n=1 Tax=Rhynchosia yellow mosaic India virus TaxID=935473 RepID=E7CWL2_9GEMI|nr:hypothetical protein [Rhynchosia yellow mosaic India virus]ADU02161.1 unknown [Rhynchosia yellow mosaic India virus]ADU02167.1 unknown [Rhynchosia yellow mosaic India virus]